MIYDDVMIKNHPVLSYFFAEGWDESEVACIASADDLGYDMIALDKMIKAMGREHEMYTVFNIRNIACNLI